MSSAVRARRGIALLVVAVLASLLAPVAAGAVPVAPSGLTPNGTVEGANPVLDWAVVPDVTNYRIQISVDPAYGTTLVNTTTYNSSYSPIIELPTGTIYWRVAAIDGDGTGPYASASFTKTLVAPTLVAPADGAVLTFPTEATTFSWNALDMARSYKLEIDDAADFIGATSVVTTNLSYTLPTTQDYGQTYYWRVTGSSNASGTGVLTPPSVTRTYSLVWPDVPVPLNPPNTTLTPITDVFFDWTDVLGAASYELQVSISIDFNPPIVLTVPTIKGSAYVDADHFDNGSYFWRVRAKDADGHVGAWSTVFAFTRGWSDDGSAEPCYPSQLGCVAAPGTIGDGGPAGAGPGSTSISNGDLGAGPGVCTSPSRQLLYPADGATMSTTVHFSWCPSYRASHYELQLDSDSNFSSPQSCFTIQTELYVHGGGASTPGGCTGLTADANVFWRVRAIDDGSGGVGLWSETRDFVRGQQVIAQVSPVGFATADVPIFDWTPVQGAGSYTIRVYDDDGTQLASGTTQATRWTPPTDLSLLSSATPTPWALPETLTWTVEANTGEMAGPATFDLLAPAPLLASPTPVAPANGTASSDMPALEWGWTTGAVSYDLHVIDTSSTVEVLTVTDLFYPSWTPTTLLPGGTYSWYVEARDGVDALVATGASRTFDVIGIEGATTYLTPAVCAPPAVCDQVTSSPLLSWTPVFGAVSYTVYVAFDEFFTNIDRTYTTTSNTMFVPREELPDNNVGQAYYWYVRPCTLAGCAPVPTGLTVEHGAFQKRSVPVELVSPDDLSISTDEPLFAWTPHLSTTWADDLEAMEYRIEVSTSPTMSPLLDSATVETSFYTPWNKTYPEGPLYWRVRAIDKSGNNLTWSPTFLTTKASPDIVRQTPADGASLLGDPTFTWDAQEGAVDYVIEVYANGDTAFSPVNKVLTVTTSAVEHTPVDPLPVGTYAWRIKRKDQGNLDGPWTDGWTFTIDERSPTLVGPADGAFFLDDEIAFEWAMNPDAASYRFQRSSTAAFISIAETVTTGMTTWRPTARYPDGIWYWRVQALDADNNVVGTSAVRSFERDTQVPPDPPTAVTGMPGDQQVTVSWTAPGDDGGTPLTGYTVTASPGGATCTSTPPTTTCVVTGLTNGTPYTFTVVATNIRGDSVPSAPSAAITPSVPPDAPTAVVASPDNASADVSWTPPIDDGGVPITSYTVTASPGGRTCSTSGTTCTVTGLTNGVSYTFTVVATNARGDSPPSAPSNAVTPAAVPGKPTGVVGIPGDQQVAVSWTAPASTGGSPITGYTVTSTPGGFTCTSTPPTTTCVVGGLTNGTSYTFRVVATNVAGDSLPSNPTASITPSVPPDAPTGVVAVGGNASADISWTAPYDGGVPITGYTVTASPGPRTCTTSGATSCTVTNLTNGVSYTFTVVATNARGDSPASAPSNAVTPIAVPGKPTAVQVVPGDQQVTVSWTAPVVTGGSPITGYTVTSSPGGFTCTSVAPTTTCVVSGLTNGTSYTFTVVATNAAGDSLPSSASAATTPSTPPDAPTGVTATPGNTTALVSWTAPYDGGVPITGYTVSASPGTRTCTTTTLTSCTVTGLTNGTSYTFTVVATNARGDSPASAPSNAVIPVTVPGKPTGVVVVPADQQVTVSWTAPVVTGGTPITGYTVTSSPDGVTCSSGAPTTTCVVTGLTNGVSYTFTVVATNAVGDSLPSNASPSTTPSVPPDAPTGATAAAGNKAATVSWTAPYDGGVPITGYTVTASPGGRTCSTSSTSCTVTGLTNGVTYTFTVTATNARGTSPASAPSNAVIPATVPSAPFGVQVVPADQQVTVSWTTPVSDGGLPITGYTVTSTPGGFTCSTVPPTTTCVVGGLTNGTSYTFRVVATNAVGDSAPSGASPSTTPSVPPDAPTGVVAVPGNTNAVISWTAPYNGGVPITGYTVSASPGTRTCSTSSTSCTVTGLTNGVTYTFTVTATNARGTSPASAPSNAVTPVAVPGKPTGVTGIPGDQQVTVSWNAPSVTGGTPITGYTVTSTPGSFTCSTVAPTTTCVVSGLTNGTGYTFTVVATNAAGDSLPSSPSAAIIPSVPPDAPTAVVAVPGNTNAVISWTAPASNGGVPITGYTVSASPGTRTCTTTLLTCTVTGLTNGVSYTFTVTATNARGTSPASAPSNAVTPVAVPGKPTSVTGIPSDQQVTVSWNAPSVTGGTPITGYTVTSSPGGFTCTSAAPTTTCVVSGLTNGTSYTFTVVATNAAGNSLPSNPTASITPSVPPDAPTGVVATPGNTNALVSWTAPVDDGGVPITGYTVTASPGPRTCTTTTLTSCTVTGLTNGVSYTFTVTATNARGTSPASAPSAAVIPATVPSAPTGVQVVPANQQVTVSWTTPVSNGGLPITGYTVTSTPGGVTCSTVAPTTTCVVSGLTNGTSYTFRVVATNTVGDSVPSGASQSTTPSVPPDAPTAVSAVPGNATALVSWVAPYNGGVPITGYTVTSSPEGRTCTATTLTSCTVTGLTNGTSYTFTVTATNARGTSPASAPSNSVTPIAVPGKPTGVVGVPGDQQVTVSWTAPGAIGGSPITGYTVTSTPGSFTCSTVAPTTTCVVTGLTNGTSYTFQVVATNAAGDGLPSSASAPVTPSVPPDAPTGITAVPGNTTATISWTAPADNGGVPISGYTVTASPGPRTCTTTSLTSCTISALTNGVSYTFTVTATNARGTSPASAPSNAVTPAAVPGAPTTVLAVPGNQQVTVSWTAPVSNGGQPITGYTVTSTPGAFTCTSVAPTTTCVVTGLTNGLSYTFSVVATNVIGSSAPSTASSAVTPRTVPSAPTGVVAVPGNAQASISWTPSASTGGSSIQGYTVTASPGGRTCSTVGTSCTVTSLTNGTPHTFTVVAVNAAGSSAPSAPSSAVTPAALPGPPTGALAVAGTQQATITWTAPASNGGSPIIGYTVTSSPGSLTCSTAGTIGCVVTGLVNGTPYTFSVVATTAIGSSIPSSPSPQIIPVSVPGPPTGVTGDSANASVVVSWTEPVSTGGTPITSYTVTSAPGGRTCTTGGTSCTVNGLANGTPYTFTVVATNAAGSGAPSSTSAPVAPLGPPQPPTGASAVAGSGSAVVSWVAPLNNGGSPITGYTVTSTPGGETCTSAVLTTCAVTGLTNGTSYTFRVVATNALGSSTPSAASSAVVPAGVPGPPTAVVGTPGDTTVFVDWTPPLSTGGVPLTSYTVSAAPGGAQCTSSAPASACTVAGLTNGVSYTFTVIAANAQGTSAPSAPSPAVTPGVIGACDAPNTGPFPDVPRTNPFCDDIDWLVNEGITSGFADGGYHPTSSVTRQSMAAFLYRFAGSPAFTPPAIRSFNDVPTSHVFFKEIEWLADSRVTGGFADGGYHPTSAVTRQSMAAFLYRFAGSPAFTPGSPSFNDVPTNHPFFKEIEWLATTGITAGFADGGFHPTSAVSRQSMAAFLHRYDGLGF